MRSSVLLVAVALMLASSLSIADKAGRVQYKWKDTAGNVHFADTLPDEALLTGYDVINGQGILVKHVDRPKTADEMKADDSAKAQAAEVKRLADDQAKRDKQTLAAYPSEKDLITAQTSQNDMIDQSIHATELSLANQEKSLTEQLAHAASLDRNGKPVPATLQSQIDALRQNIEKQKAYILRKQQEKVTAAAKAAVDLEHYRQLQARAAH